MSFVVAVTQPAVLLPAYLQHLCRAVLACRTLSYLSEGMIFIYVGMDALDPYKWKVGRGWKLDLASPVKSGRDILSSTCQKAGS